MRERNANVKELPAADSSVPSREGRELGPAAVWVGEPGIR